MRKEVGFERDTLLAKTGIQLLRSLLFSVLLDLGRKEHEEV